MNDLFNTDMKTLEERITADMARLPRPIYAIAAEIRKKWPKPYFGAVPYLDAMMSLREITDKYGCDDARGIIAYFLGNATTWRGEDARRIKAELNNMLKGK